jgi:hypothetical protein
MSNTRYLAEFKLAVAAGPRDATFTSAGTGLSYFYCDQHADFPYTPILDAFDATALQNLNAPRSGWSTATEATMPGTFQTDAVPTTAVAATSTSSAFRTATAVDVECWARFGGTPSGGTWKLLARNNLDGSNFCNCYCVTHLVGNIAIWKIVAGAFTKLSPVPDLHIPSLASMQPGDSLGMRVKGNVITAYYRPAGGDWMRIVSVTDSTYTTAGTIGCGTSLAAASAVLEEFGGGEVVTERKPRPPMPHAAQAAINRATW